ncbi:MAG: 2Fe-2S iron-sulfur cluster-binding protein [Candidatus Dormibacteria bacterium]
MGWGRRRRRRDADLLVDVVVDGTVHRVLSGRSVAGALHGIGVRGWPMPEGGLPGGPYCGMGACYRCEVTIDGARSRACLTHSRAGMTVETTRPQGRAKS